MCVRVCPMSPRELSEGGFHKLVLVHTTALHLRGLALFFPILTLPEEVLSSSLP